MPALNRDPQVEVADGKLEQTVRYYVEQLAQVPELYRVRCQIM